MLQGVRADEAIEACRIPADPDILGLGVRLGLYFQLLSSCIVAIVRPSEGVGSLTVSNILFSGIFIAVAHSTLNNDMPASVVLSSISLLTMDVFLVVPTLTLANTKNLQVKVSFWTS
jgi:hypothetical protein